MVLHEFYNHFQAIGRHTKDINLNGFFLVRVVVLDRVLDEIGDLRCLGRNVKALAVLALRRK
jgi:hypothetical protein